MVDIVLRGEADLLIGAKSEDKEVQEFINNAEIFKSKVQKIHDAVKNGSLKALQEHLDRRKFCMARDINTNVNILQKSILYGHQSIFRYLTSNFQELINIKDSHGRTSLHYAAALPDNNYIYKTLIHRGADTSAKDVSGKTPGHYNKNKKDLNKTMLVNFMNGTATAKTSATKPSEKVVKAAVKTPLESKKSRLLSALLKKSRSDNEIFTDDLDQESIEKVDKIYEMVNGKKEKNKVVKNHHLKIDVDQQTFDRIKTRVTKMSGGSLLHVLDLCQHLEEGHHEDHHQLPLLAPDPTAYDVFSDLFTPWIELHHSYRVGEHFPDMYWGDSSAFSEHFHSGPNIKLIELQLVRSIVGIPFSPRMTVDHFVAVEKQVKEALKHLDSSLSGLYLSLDSTNWSPEMVNHLTQENILFDRQAPLYDQPLRQHWPVGRAVFHSKNKDFVAWINHSEHLILRSLEKRGNVRAAVERLQSCVSALDKRLQFTRHQKLGYLALKPSHCGTGLKVKVTLELPKLANDVKTLKSVCIRYDIVIINQNIFSFTLGSSSSMGLTEFQLLAHFFTGIKEILEFEQ